MTATHSAALLFFIFRVFTMTCRSTGRNIITLVDLTEPVYATHKLCENTRRVHSTLRRYHDTSPLHYLLDERCHMRTYRLTISPNSSFSPCPFTSILCYDEDTQLVWAHPTRGHVIDFATNGVLVYVSEWTRKHGFFIHTLNAETGTRVGDRKSAQRVVDNMWLHDGYLYGSVDDSVVRWRCGDLCREEFATLGGASFIAWMGTLGDYLIVFDGGRARNLVYDVYGNCLQTFGIVNHLIFGRLRPGTVVHGCLVLSFFSADGLVKRGWRLAEVPSLLRICLCCIRREGPLLRATDRLKRLPEDLQLRLSDLILPEPEQQCSAPDAQPEKRRRVYDLRPRKNRKIKY